MTTVQKPAANLAPPIESVLARLRRGIQTYIWVEGLAAGLIVLGLSFWLSIGFDWLFEPPSPLRALVMLVVAIILAVVLFRFILRRAFVELANRNMAVLLERKFERFHDSLLTVVEMSEVPEHADEFNREMLAHTGDEALAGTRELPLTQVFNLRPLVRFVGLALLLVASIVGFGIAASDAFGIWARRNLLLSAEAWPRNTTLFVVGFQDGRTKIARGSDLDLLVRADAAPGRQVPEVVEIRYTTEDGARGRENMSRSGTVTPGEGAFQEYTFTFKGVLNPIDFTVRGGDDRVGPLHLEVVDSPTVSEMVLHCEYPEYMRRAPRDIPVTGVMQLPLGTRVTIVAETNKDVVQVQIDEVIDETTPVTHKLDLRTAESAAGRSFQHLIESLNADKTLLFTLLDTDGIRSREPVRLALGAAADESPQLSVQLKGIGTAITPEARLPMSGEISDDYGLAKAWFEVRVDEGEPLVRPFQAAITGQDKLSVEEALEVAEYQLAPKQKLHLAVKAADAYALSAAPNVGSSQRYLLDVVTPAQLRSMLEARELMLRRRFETIIQEMTENRDAIARIDFGTRRSEKPVSAAAEAAEPEPEPEDSARTAEPAAADRTLTLRRVHVERALQNEQRSADETLGVATSFDEIRDELINNRVDTEELKTRLKDGIADPLRRIVAEMYPEFESRLRKLQAGIADPEAGATAQRAARDQADAILVQMNLVLDKMLELETFNEVLDLLRGIIGSQEKLNDQTKQRQKDKLRNLLED